jgi:hypothetical protein
MAAADRTGNSIVFDATTDTYAAQIVEIGGLTFQGTGLTAGNRLVLTDDGGSVIADYIIEAAADNADLWNGRDPKFYMGLKIGAGSLAGGGTWALTVITN